MGFGSGWYYNDVSGDVVHASALTSIGEGLVPGWHGPYATEQAAMKHAGVSGATAVANESVPGSVINTGVNVATSDTIGNVNIGSLAIRAGEIILGIVLIGVGVAKLSGAENAIATAVKVAK